METRLGPTGGRPNSISPSTRRYRPVPGTAAVPPCLPVREDPPRSPELPETGKCPSVDTSGPGPQPVSQREGAICVLTACRGPVVFRQSVDSTPASHQSKPVCASRSRSRSWQRGQQDGSSRRRTVPARDCRVRLRLRPADRVAATREGLPGHPREHAPGPGSPTGVASDWKPSNQVARRQPRDSIRSALRYSAGSVKLIIQLMPNRSVTVPK